MRIVQWPWSRNPVRARFASVSRRLFKFLSVWVVGWFVSAAADVYRCVIKVAIEPSRPVCDEDGKVLGSTGPFSVEALKREIRAYTTVIAHENIVRCFLTDEAAGLVILELVEGPHLHDLLIADTGCQLSYARLSTWYQLRRAPSLAPLLALKCFLGIGNSARPLSTSIRSV